MDKYIQKFIEENHIENAQIIDYSDYIEIRSEVNGQIESWIINKRKSQ